MLRAPVELGRGLGRTVCPPDSGNPHFFKGLSPCLEVRGGRCCGTYYPIMSQI